jgi:hypothetical protein
MREYLLCTQIETERENDPGRSTERAERAGGSAFFRDAQQSLKILWRNWKRVKKPEREAISAKIESESRNAQQQD